MATYSGPVQTQLARHRKIRRRQLLLEALEDRRLLSRSPLGLQDWGDLSLPGADAELGTGPAARGHVASAIDGQPPAGPSSLPRGISPAVLRASARPTHSPIFASLIDSHSSVSQELVDRLVANLTTTASPHEFAQLYRETDGIDDPPISIQTAESTPLISLDDFRAAPRFAGVDGSGYSAVIIDTGINRSHPDFGPDSDSDGIADRIVYSYDFHDSDDEDATDHDGHGSNVSSIVASSNSTRTGMAPAAGIIHLKVFPDAPEANGDFLARSEDIEQALQWTIANAAVYNIASVNLSLGGSNYDAYRASSYYDEFAALAELNVIAVAATGNDFYPLGSVEGVGNVAADPNVIGVGAVYDANVGPASYENGAQAFTTGADRIAPFSQRHPELLDIFAPGARITGASHEEDETVTMSGTSQASPHVAGIAVLAQQLAVQELGRRLTAEEFATLMETSGVTVHDGDDEDDNVENRNRDYKRVDVLALGDALLDQRPGQIGGTVFRDDNGDGILAGEPGLAEWTVYLDDNDNGVRDASSTVVNSTNVPRTLDDGAAIRSSLTVSGVPGVITDVNVQINLAHSYVSDVSAFLMSPTGTRVELFTRVGGSGDNFNNTILDDEATQAITAGLAPFSGTYRPEGGLLELDGQIANGEWQLELADPFEGDPGTLNSWSLTIQYAERTAITNGDGAYSFTGLTPKSYVLREVLDEGYTETTSSPQVVTLLPGETQSGVNFGNEPDQAPTVVVNIVDGALNDSDPDSQVTFEFSEDVSGFTVTDLLVSGGSVSGFSAVDGNSYIATFTAADDVELTGSVEVTAASYTDAAENAGAGGSDTVAIDRLNPSVAVNIVDGSLNDGDSSSSVTFEFSEDVAGFALADVAAAGGTLSSFIAVDGNSFTATFTATDGVSTAGSVSIAASSYADAAGNLGAAGSDNVTIDTQNPTVVVNIVDAALSDMDSSSNVTFEFSENVTGFVLADVTMAGGTLSNFTAVDGNSFIATFTATDGIRAAGSVAVTADSYSDSNGNLGGAGSDTVAIDTLNPSVTVNQSAGQADPTAASPITFSIVFSENVTGFSSADVSFAGSTAPGTLSAAVSGGGASYSVTVSGMTGTGTVMISLPAGTAADSAGNLSVASSSTDNSVTYEMPVLTEILVTTFSDVVNASDGLISLREAVIQANATPGDNTIILPAGTYALSIGGQVENAATTGDLDIAGDSVVAIAGAGAAQTVIDATGLNDRLFHVLDGGDLTLDGVTLTGGGGAEEPATAWGGAVINFGTLAITNSILTNNVATNTGGGAVANTLGGIATISHSTLSSNSGGRGGGAIRNEGLLSVSDSLIDSNYSKAGGGIRNIAGSLTVERTTISNNIASSFDLLNYGGGIDSIAGSVSVIDSTINGNAAEAGGGISNAAGATLTVRSSVIHENSASAEGGGLWNDGTATLLGSTLSTNEAGVGAAAHVAANGVLNVFHSTVTNNSATGSGGGVSVDGQANLLDTILAGNAAPVGPDGSSGTGVVSQGHNLIGDNTELGFTPAAGDLVGTQSGPLDPRLGPLQDNGGSTFTHALLSGSPALDAGHSTFTPGSFAPPLSTDQRGLPREMDGTGDGSVLIDIGAFESQVDLQSPAVISLNAGDLLISDSDTGAGKTFTVVVEFSEAMDPAAPPTMTFSASVGTTLSLNAASSAWLDVDTYRAVYAVADANVALADITIDVSGTRDVAGNSQYDYAPEAEFSIDTLNASVTVNIVDASLNDTDSSSQVTFEFSENVVDFALADVSASGGTLSNFAAGDGNSFTATFTATDGVSTTGSVSVAASSYTDAVGNVGAAGSDNVTIDRLNPTVVVTIVDPSLSDADSSSNVTFEFSENVSGFTSADAAVSGGALSNFGAVDGNSFTATFTATDGVSTTGSVSVAASSYTDAVGNVGAAGSDNVSIDRLNPTVVVNIVDASLSDADSSSNVTFEFSENVSGFTSADATVSGGALSNFAAVDGNSFTATFTATDGVSTTGSVSVAASSYTDAVGNVGAAGSDNVTIDRLNPTVVVNIVDVSLNDTDSSSNVTFEFSETVSGFTSADATVSGGTLSNFAQVDGDSFTAIFTATDGVSTTGSVSVAASSYTDAVGNLGVAGSDNVTIDRQNPTVVVNIVDVSLNDTDSSSNVTFEFSETVTGFALADVTATGGTLSNFTPVDGNSFTAVFTASGVATSGSVAVAADSYTNIAGNLGGAGSDTVEIEVPSVTVAVNVLKTTLHDGDPSSTVSFEFSESVSGFTVADVTVAGGLLSDFAMVDADSYSAVFTASDGLESVGMVTVTAGSYTDLVGNPGLGGSDTVLIDTLNPTVVVDILDALLRDADASSDVTFEFSENVTGFTSADVTSVGGSLLSFTAVDGNSYTATFAATDGVDMTGSVTVIADSYADTAGNVGGSGSDTVQIDTQNPTVVVNIVDASLNDTDNSSEVMFEFSENVSGFTLADLTTTGGGLSNFTAVDADSFTAIFTAADGATAGSAAVLADSYTDAVGNLGEGGSDNVPIEGPQITASFTASSQAQPESAGTMTLVVALSAVADQDVTIPFALAGTATEGVTADYTVTSSPLTIPAGATEGAIVITLNADSIVEWNETVTVTLSAPIHASLGAVTEHTATIQNDDTAAVSINDVWVDEGDSGSPALTFTVSLDHEASHDITVMASTSGLTATGGGTDFTDLVNQVVTISAGSTSAPVTVFVTGDEIPEPYETFAVTLADSKFDNVTDAARVTLGDAEGIGTIRDDEPLVLTLELAAASTSEAGGPAATTATVRRTGDLSAALVVTIVNPDDTELYLPASVTIPQGQPSVQFDVDSVNDGALDGDVEGLAVIAQASGFANGTATISVTDDDTLVDRTLGGHLYGTVEADIYRVLFDVQVDSGKTLTTQPGSTLRFLADTALIVSGSLQAVGEEGSPVVFTSAAATPARGDWDGVSVIGSSARSNLAHTAVSFADYGLLVSPASAANVQVTLRDSDLHDSTYGVAVSAYDFSYPESISATDVQIIGNHLHDNAYGVYLTASSGMGRSLPQPPYYIIPNGSNYASVSNNEIDHNSTAGIHLSASSYSFDSYPTTSGAVGSAISGNSIHHNLTGIQGRAFPGGLPLTYPLIGWDYSNNGASLSPAIANNLISHNTGDGIDLAASSQSNVYLRPKVVNNTIVNNGGAGIEHSVYTDSGFALRNNIVSSNEYGIRAAASYVPSAGTVNYNLIFDNASADFSNYPATYGDLTGVNANGTPADAEMNISAAPAFVSASDYHLSALSPAIDAGSSADAPLLDFDGDPRVGTVDIGYDEVVNQAPTAVTADPNPASLPENTSTVTSVKVADLTVSDDGLGTNELTLAGTDAASFLIVGTELHVKASTVLDYETKPTYTVTVQVDDPTVGSTPDASVSFTLNLAPSAAIIDDGDAGFSIVSGTWYSSGGYLGDTRYTLKGTGSSVAQWQFPVVPGAYRVSATWAAHSNRATDAPFTVYNGSAALSTIDINQELPPNDRVEAGANWEDLGVFQITANTLMVRLSNQANEYVIADAIRIEPVIVVNQPPTAVTADPNPASLAETTSTANSVKVADLTVTDDGLGTNALSLTGADAAAFEIVGTALYLKAGTVLDYETKPTYSVTVQIDDPTAGATPDASVSFHLEVTTTSALINDTPGIVSGIWYNTSGYLGDARYTLKGTGSSVAQWQFAVTPGNYRVSATWAAHSNRATDAPFTVYNGSAALSTIDINQELTPNDRVDAGAAWEDLGVFSITANTLMVRLTNQANDYVIADAIRIEPIAVEPALTLSIAGGPISENGGSATGTITRGGGSSGELIVALTSSDPGEASVPASVTIPDGEPSATFTITGEDDAVADGTQSVTITAVAEGYTSGDGTLSVTDDEGVPPQIVDDGDSGFRIVSGVWSSGGGYLGDTRYVTKGTGSSVAEWQFAVTPGAYRVSATWVPYVNRATDAPFTVYNGSAALGTIDVNQELAPNDRVDAGADWEDLGVFEITANTLMVRLTNQANDYVIADAIRIEPIAVTPALTLTIAGGPISENGGSATGTVTRSGSSSGELILALTSSDPGEASVPASVTIPDGEPSVSFSIAGVDDAVADGTQSVTITAVAEGYTSGDGTLSVTDDEGVPPQIVDDGDSGFRIVSGVWSSGGGYLGDTRYVTKGTGSSVAEWQFAVTPGNYRVSATWVPYVNRATDAPFTVYNGSAALGTIDINQELTPNDRTDAGADWEDLGVFEITASTLMVRLTNQANEYVIADAIRIEPIAVEPALTLTIAGGPISENGGSATGTVTRGGSSSGELIVALTSSDPGEASVPASVTIPDGEPSVTFPIAGVDDAVADGPQSVTITAVAEGYTSGNGTLSVTDDEGVPPQIVDDGDPGFRIVSGVWSSGSGYLGDMRYVNKGNGSSVAQWQFAVTPGSYRVSATWVPFFNRATDAPFTVLNGTTALGTIDVNQELAPNDRTDAGAAWEDLGVFQISGTTLVVRLTNQANEYVIADGIRIEAITAQPSPILASILAAGGFSATEPMKESTRAAEVLVIDRVAAGAAVSVPVALDTAAWPDSGPSLTGGPEAEKVAHASLSTAAWSQLSDLALADADDLLLDLDDLLELP